MINSSLDDEVMTVREVSQFLKICRKNTYDLFNKNNFPCISIGKSKRVRKSDLIIYIKTNLINNSNNH